MTQSSSKKYYRVVNTDGVSYCIQKTSDKPDGMYVFDTFLKAKTRLLCLVREKRDELNEIINKAKALRIDDLE